MDTPPGLLDKELIEKAARSGLYFRDFTEFVHSWKARPHQETWFDALQQLADGVLLDKKGHPTRKLMILAPPGSGKTDTMIEFNAWLIGRDLLAGNMPQLGYVSYSDDVAMIRSLAIRETIEFSEKYQMVFPMAAPNKDKRWSAHEWFLWREDVSKKDPTFRAAGVTGGILSYRFPTMITIDDPHDPKNIKTLHQKDEVWRIYRSTIKTRAQQETPIVLICTRWAEDDLAGRIMKVEGDWHIVHTPALNAEDETYWPSEGKSGMGFDTQSLHILRQQDRESFITQYMALPPSAEGDIFKWWSFAPRPYMAEAQRIYQCWDTAYTKKAWSSYSAMVEMVHLKNGRLFISRAFREKMEFPKLIDAVIENYTLAEKEYPGIDIMLLVENKASGTPIVQMFQQALPGRVKAVDLPRHGIPTGRSFSFQQKDMHSRAAAISKYFETGHVLLPEYWTEWKDEYLDEMRAFPRGQYNDQVSATVLGLEYVYPNRIVDYTYQAEVRYQGWND